MATIHALAEIFGWCLKIGLVIIGLIALAFAIGMITYIILSIIGYYMEKKDDSQ